MYPTIARIYARKYSSVAPAFVGQEDLTQVALIAQWQRSEEICGKNKNNTGVSPEARAAIVSRNAIIDYIRSIVGRKGHKPVEISWDELAQEQAIPVLALAVDPYRILLAKEQVALLYKAKEPHTRQLINGLLAGKSKKEIAEDCGVSDSAISQTIMRLRKRYA